MLVLAVAILSETMGVVDAYEWTCNLFCYNKGTCRYGHGKFGAYNGIDSQTDELPFEQELHDNGMYCTCPVGFTGLQCEIKYVTCGRDNHTCFNGSACVKERSSNDGNVFYRCECDVTESVMDAPYAGKYCEHIATSFCDGDDGFSHALENELCGMLTSKLVSMPESCHKMLKKNSNRKLLSNLRFIVV